MTTMMNGGALRGARQRSTHYRTLYERSTVEEMEKRKRAGRALVNLVTAGPPSPPVRKAPPVPGEVPNEDSENSEDAYTRAYRALRKAGMKPERARRVARQATTNPPRRRRSK